MRLLAPLALTYTVHRISRRVGLASKTTMGDLARYYAVALDEMFQEPVDVLGISTGGSQPTRLLVANLAAMSATPSKTGFIGTMVAVPARSGTRDVKERLPADAGSRRRFSRCETLSSA